ncbi:MAG: extracellular solute-binding protein, partial [Fibrobacteres bacterium]|nr:extracellular solute-binding protein [Fibrobacterota bacterium]
LLSKAIDVFEAPAIADMAGEDIVENLESRIATDLDTSSYLNGALDRYSVFDFKEGRYKRVSIPVYFGVRLTSYDRAIFRDNNVDTLPLVPTPLDVMTRAAKISGINPKTGKQNYGLYFQGRYKIFLVPNLMDAFGGGWGKLNNDGSYSFDFTKPENVEAIVWLLQASQYCPPSIFGSGEDQESLWGTIDNNVAIRLHAFGNDLFVQNKMSGCKDIDGGYRFRYVQLFRDQKGGGGFAFGSPLAIASSSPHKDAAWRFIKWMSSGEKAQSYIANSLSSYPVIKPAYEQPVFKENINFKNAFAEMNVRTTTVPYLGTPIRYTLENDLDKALFKAKECGYDSLKLRALAKEYLVSLQNTAENWVASESKVPQSAMRPFYISKFARPFFAVMLFLIIIVIFISRKTLKANFHWYLFLLPSILVMAVFLAYPIAESFRLSLFKSNGFTEAFIGINNYRTILSDSNFYNSLYNTAYIALFNLAIGIPIGFILASMINSQKKVQSVFKVLYFMPMVTSVIASAVLFKYMFSPDMGLVNFLLQKIGVNTTGLMWLSSPETSKFVVIFFALWHGTGYTVLICLSGLQSVPDQLYEAASIDGCGQLQKWWHITLPNMRPIFVFLIMTGCIGALKRFEDVFTFGGMLGSPSRSMQTVVAYIFEQAFGAFNFGAASAAAYVLFLIILIVTIVNYRFSTGKE